MNGGLGSIERFLAMPMNTRLIVFENNLHPHLYPRFDMDTTEIVVVSGSMLQLHLWEKAIIKNLWAGGCPKSVNSG